MSVFARLLLGVGCLGYVHPVYAYLDPGTGSMLVYFLLGILATAVYSAKNLLFTLRGLVGLRGGKDLRKAMAKPAELVFYSEGGKYWDVFFPVIQALEKMGLSSTYYTSDDKDPALCADFVHLRALYLGKGISGYTRLNSLKARVVVMTTPQLDVMWLKRSPHVQHYVHLIHAPTDALLYRKFAFDYFDSVMCSGAHQMDSIRALEQARGLPAKRLLKTGLTYYDNLHAQHKQAPRAQKKHSQGEFPTILVAPTWGKNGLLARYGTAPITALLAAGMRIVLRPHPQSYVSEQALMHRVEEEFRTASNLCIDKNPDPGQAMQQVDLLVSDVSGIIFDFCFVYKKPVVLLHAPIQSGGMEAEDVDQGIWEEALFPRVATLVLSGQIQQLPDLVRQALQTPQVAAITRIRDESVFNFGKAGEVAAQQLAQMLEQP